MTKRDQDGIPKPSSEYQTVNMTEIVRDAYDHPNYSDLVIECGKHTFPVHKMIVCPQVDFLRAACCGNSKTEINGKIRVRHVEPAVMDKMVQFLYTTDYTMDLLPPSDDDEVEIKSETAEKSPQLVAASIETNQAVPVNLPEVPIRPDTHELPTPVNKPASIFQGAEVFTQRSDNDDGNEEEEEEEKEEVEGKGSESESDENDNNDPDEFVEICLVNPAFFHVRMYKWATKYKIKPLCYLAVVKFREQIRKGILKDYLEDLIYEVYSDEDRDTYEGMLSGALVAEVVTLVFYSRFKGLDILSTAFLKESPGFTFDLCCAIMKKIGRLPERSMLEFLGLGRPVET
ncbi:hypothetical protein N7539_006802 [Penicillium diatomitis]|uniref:BTB domain-containing protein n=1 Tax=Penicillium diatomitis TaxID=2819901 RepID=A0A9X0BSF7_9EURO|nr:uncharacterized protein N7539_006802 [Penicillium diatomitis]KAJ5480908.1 hypothetical protein N7539_006802 [Penicillium diatomitis]